MENEAPDSPSGLTSIDAVVDGAAAEEASNTDAQQPSDLDVISSYTHTGETPSGRQNSDELEELTQKDDSTVSQEVDSQHAEWKDAQEFLDCWKIHLLREFLDHVIEKADWVILKFILANFTSILQTLDVGLNKPFKDFL